MQTTKQDNLKRKINFQCWTLDELKMKANHDNLTSENLQENAKCEP